MSKVNNYNFSHCANAAIDASGTRDDFKGGNSDISANDRPYCGLTPPVVISQNLKNTCPAVDIDMVARLDLDGADLPHITEAMTSLSEDEMSLSALRRMPSFIGSFTVREDHTVGERLAQFDLCPGSEFFYLATGDTADVSLLTFATLGSSFWRGDLIFTFECLATAYHSVTLAFCSGYGVNMDNADILESTSQYVQYGLVTGGTTRFTVRVPWVSNTPQKRVCNGSYPNTNEFSTGNLYVRVSVPLTRNELVSPTLDINTYVSFEGTVSFLGNSAMDVVPVSVPIGAVPLLPPL